MGRSIGLVYVICEHGKVVWRKSDGARIHQPDLYRDILHDLLRDVDGHSLSYGEQQCKTIRLQFKIDGIVVDYIYTIDDGKVVRYIYSLSLDARAVFSSDGVVYKQYANDNAPSKDNMERLDKCIEQIHTYIKLESTILKRTLSTNGKIYVESRELDLIDNTDYNKIILNKSLRS